MRAPMDSQMGTFGREATWTQGRHAYNAWARSRSLYPDEVAAVKKTPLIANFVLWAIVTVLCCAFLAWYHLGGSTGESQTIATTVPGRIGVTLAAPVLLYGLGAVTGLLVIIYKRIAISPRIKTGCRIAGVLMLALFVAAAIPVVIGGIEGELALPTVIVVYSAMAAPLLIMAFGVCWAIGCAPVDEKRSDGAA